MTLARNKPQLKVITGSPEVETAAGEFRIAALGELPSSQRGLVERVVSQICPNAGILGVVVKSSHWDLRPVVVFPVDNSPSVLRFLGPDVALASSIQTRVEDTFRRLSSYSDLSSQLKEHGIFEEQLWYRRCLVDFTLDKILAESEYVTFEQAQLLSKNLVQHVDNMHARGIVHGHISPSNVSVVAGGDTVLVDVGVGISVFQAAMQADVSVDYDLKSLAPEVQESENLPFSADIYSLGGTLKELFMRVSLRDEEGEFNGERDERSRRFVDICNNMLQKNPSRRPSLTRVKQIFFSNRKSSPRKRKRTATRSIPRGKIITGKHLEEPLAIQEIVKETPEVVEAPPRVEAATPRKVEPEVKSNPIFEESLFEEPAIEEPAIEELATEAPATEEPAVEETQEKQFNFESSVAVEQTAGEIHTIEDEFNSEALKEIEAERAARLQEPEPFESGSEVSGVEESRMEAAAEEEESWTLGETTASPAAESDKASAMLRWFVILVFVACAGLLFMRGFGGNTEQEVFVSYEQEQLSRLWESRRPSQMSEVALEAVREDSGNRAFAEDLIVGSALRGEQLPEQISVSLLRISFDSRWERDLRVGDRRAAIALATDALLGEKMPQDLPTIDKLHPGVLLALTVTAPGASKILGEIPMSSLTELPPPLAPAFDALSADPEAKTLGDYSVRFLASLSTKGVRGHDFRAVEELNIFVSQHTMVRLKALAWLFSEDENGARQLLAILLNHKNLQPQHESFRWGRMFDLTDWEGREFSNVDQLFLLAGLKPAGKIKTEHIVPLFAHPDAGIRSFAIEEALNRISFEHPAAVIVLKGISDNPQILTGEQTLQLARILAQPKQVKENEILAWLKTKPPVVIVETLLLSTVDEQEPSILDFRLYQYLKENKWEPSLKALRSLSRHPEPSARILAYTKIFNFENRDVALKLLSDALKVERMPAYREVLTDMVKGLQSPN